MSTIFLTPPAQAEVRELMRQIEATQDKDSNLYQKLKDQVRILLDSAAQSSPRR